MYSGLSALGTFLYSGLSALGTFLYPGLSALGSFLYPGLPAQEQLFVSTFFLDYMVLGNCGP